MTRSTCRMLAAFAIASALALTGCAPTNAQPGGTVTTNNASRPFGGTRPAKEVFTEFLDTIGDTVLRSGTTFPGWDRKRTAGYSTEVCGIKSREDGNRYTVTGDGGPIADPKAAIEAMKTHWEAKRYTIGNIFDETETTSGKGMDINATTPTGMVVHFSASTFGSFISVKSDCTLDPVARKTTTGTILLGNSAGS